MSDERKSLQQLEDAFEELERRCSAKLNELADAERTVRGLTSKLVDSADKERAGLIADRAKAVIFRDALQAEYAEIEFRRDSANLAIYEHQVTLAREEMSRWQEKLHLGRKALEEASTKLRIFMNGGRSKMPQTEGDAKLIELRINLERVKAESEIANREADRARFRFEIAQQELAEVRQELGVDKAGQA